MRIYTRIEFEWDGYRYVPVEMEGYDYPDDGLVALCKGDSTAKATELMAQQNMAAQMAFNQQLMGLFKVQFDKQDEVMQYLKGKMLPIIEAGGKGYSDEALAAMRTTATDTLSQKYQNAQKAYQAKQFAQGGRDLPSGVDAQIGAYLAQSEAADKAGTQNQITLSNEQLKQQNYWNALNTLSGVGAQFNPLGYAGAATNAANSASEAGNSVANLSQAYKSSQSSGLMGALGGLAGGIFAGAGQAGGFGKLFGCWLMAASFDGWEDKRTHLVRLWLWGVFAQRWYGRPVMKLYMQHGERLAQKPWFVKMFRPIAYLALSKAQR